MTTNSIIPALNAMRSLFGVVDPAPANGLDGRIWLYPSEYESASIDTFPFAIIAKVKNVPNTVQRNSNTSALHLWRMEAMVYLQAGDIARDSTALTAEAQDDPWALSVLAALYNHQNLYQNVLTLGSGGVLMSYREGHTNYGFSTKTFWGIQFLFDIKQNVPI